jgi:DNA invertase Pin-like site-specific DNA recombinase
MGISVLYVRISSLDGRTDRQRVNEKDFDRVVEDKCSGSVPMFDRYGGSKLKKWIDEEVISSISIWQIDRSGRDLRDILNFIHYTSERKIPIHFISQGLRTIDDSGEENPISKMVISILGVVAEMERKLIRERQREGIELAKLKGRFLGRKKGTLENPLKFLSKKRNKHAMDLLMKGYKNIEVSRITGLHPQTVSKVKRLI